MSWGPRWICLVGNFENPGSVFSDFGVGGGPLKTRMIGGPRDPIKSTFLSFDSVFSFRHREYMGFLMGVWRWNYRLFPFSGGTFCRFPIYQFNFSVFGRSFFLQIVFFSYFRKKVDHNLSGNQKSPHICYKFECH